MRPTADLLGDVRETQQTCRVTGKGRLRVRAARRPRGKGRLHARAARRLRELDALYRADAILHRSLQLDDVLQALVEVATGILNADKASVLVWDADHQRLVARAAHGYSTDSLARLAFAPDEGIAGIVVRTRQTVMVEDLHGDTRASARITRLTDAEGIRSLICVPILVGGEVYGLFNASFCKRRAFGADDGRPFEGLAQRAALAIKNAQLFEQAQQAAVLEERQRLARELHDAVTQTLFSASLLADVLPRLLERNPAEASRRLAELRTLTRGALAEMRTLLVELRPSALEETPLADLLQRLAEAATGRSHLEALTRVSGRSARQLPAEVQIALYRIAQEALNNTIKHARAHHALLELVYASSGSVTLRISDDGCGFDTEAVRAGHLGLRIMRERVASIGARLRINSAEDEGTHIQVIWRMPRRQLTSR